MTYLARRIRDVTTTVFAEFSALAIRHGAVNLGQGFPDFDGPEAIRELAIAAIRDGLNQYAPSSGLPELKQAVADHAQRFYRQVVDAATEVAITSGATEGLLDAILGLVDPGDEVVLFEPYYDSYAANVTMAGGTARYVLLHPPDAGHANWWFDATELETAFSERTKLVVVNTPHNPTGKVFDRVELEAIADLCVRHDVIALTDEVYEHIVFPPAEHVRLATLPGMAARTVTLSSAGKSFSCTGWKIGWAIANPELLAAVTRVHQFATFAVAPAFQRAVAGALALPDAYFDELRRSYAARRDLLLETLHEAELRPLGPQGSYFAIAQIDGLGFENDVAFCRYLTREVGVAAIPTSAFYSSEQAVHGSGLVRFAFCKRDQTLLQARDRLRGWARRR